MWYGPYRFCFPDRETAITNLPSVYINGVPCSDHNHSIIEHGELPGKDGWHVDVKTKLENGVPLSSLQFLVMPDTPSRIW